MREYMKNMGSILMMISLSNMVIPDGSIKKFTSLAMGFMLITAAVSAIPSEFEEISFSSETFYEESQSVSESNSYRKQVMQKHCENLEKLIAEKFSHGSKVKVQVNNDGEITDITLRIKGDESKAINFIVSQLKFSRERIRIVYDKN